MLDETTSIPPAVGRRAPGRPNHVVDIEDRPASTVVYSKCLLRP
jgi:hypothetical protein